MWRDTRDQQKVRVPASPDPRGGTYIDGADTKLRGTEYRMVLAAVNAGNEESLAPVVIVQASQKETSRFG